MGKTHMVRCFGVGGKKGLNDATHKQRWTEQKTQKSREKKKSLHKLECKPFTPVKRATSGERGECGQDRKGT